jgi:2-oxoisovalerate dehydrogenase E1 component
MTPVDGITKLLNQKRLNMERVPFDESTKRRLLSLMLESRIGDLREQSLIRQGKGWFQISSAGHEAMAAVGLLLEADDYCAPYYRDRAMVLAKGMSTHEIALNFLGKREASSGGRQLPGHFSARSLNIWSHASPVACHLLPACGIAWGLQLDGKKQVVVASLGEAATRQGDFFEAICIAKEKALPVVFVVEDNKLGISTSNEKSNPLVLGAVNPSEWQRVDGSDVEAVHQAAAGAIASARAGKGPAFLWIDLERIDSHSSADDHRNYRDAETLKGLAERDPLLRLKERMIAEGLILPDAYEALEQDTRTVVRNEYLRADRAADPQASDTLLELHAPEGDAVQPPVSLKPATRMVDAINLTLRAAVESNPDCLLYGQDVEDPKGGVFKLTAGLSSDYPRQVFNAPVAESTIIGLACGLAGYGKRPVFEIQFVDFISPAWNQLVSNLATLRWRTSGDWECPVVIYAPCGAYLPGGAIWHSQTNESLFASIPGLKVVVPSTPADSVSLFWSAIQSRDPVLVLIPKHLMWEEQKVPVQPQALALGKSRLVRAGSGITVVTWGNCLELVESASRGFDPDLLEVLDLRSVVPWDIEAIRRSVQKTGKLLIVQEDTPNCSVGQMILAELVQDPRLWKIMKATPILISRKQVHIGLNPVYEYAALPDAEQVRQAIVQLESSSIKRETLFAPVTGQALASRRLDDSKGLSGMSKVSRLHRIQVPTLGEGIQSARVVGLIKRDGDVVRYDDALCEIETDKAVFPIESSVDGSFVRWLIAVDEEVRVGQEIAEIEVEEVEVEVRSAPLQAGPAAAGKEAQSASGAVLASKKLLSSLIGKVFHSEGERERKSGLSSEIVQAMQGIVPATITLQANWAGIKEARKRAKVVYGKKAPSPSAMVAWNAVQAMKKHEMFTYTVAMDKLNRDKDTGDFDLGVAVSLPDDELATAIIRHVNKLSWEEFLDEFVAAIGKVRRGEHTPKTRAPLLISTMGPFDVRSAVPVVVPPSMATLFIGSAHFEPVPATEGYSLKEVVHLTLTFDHRWINGVGSAAFMTDVRKNIENFKLPE